MSEHQKSVKLGEIIREFDLEILHEGTNCAKVPLRTLDVNRPGLPLSGFFEHFDTMRLLVIGLTETTFLENMTPEQRRVSFDRLLAYPVPALILTRGSSRSLSAWRWQKSMTVLCCAPRPRPLLL